MDASEIKSLKILLAFPKCNKERKENDIIIVFC